MPVALELYIPFVFAVTALILMPGPTFMLVVANSLAYGTRAGIATAIGSSVGNALLATGGALGLAAVLGMLASVFDIIRWIGAAYLIYLGIRAWRATPQSMNEARPMRHRRSVFGQAVLVAITNPKTLFFYAAFFPQFIDPAQPATPQLAMLSATLVALATLFEIGYALLAGRLRIYFSDPLRTRLKNRLTGTLLIGTGIGMAIARRGS